MAFELREREASLALGAVASTALLVWFGNGLEPWWPLMWLAPLPVLLFANRSSWQSTAVVAVSAWFLGCFAMWHYFRVLQMPVPVWVGLYLPSALLFAGGVLLFRGLLIRGAAGTAAVALPAMWVSGEYLASVATANGSAGSLAYTQLRFLPLLQLASVTGPWGISFVVLLFSSALAVGLALRRSAPRLAVRVVAAMLGVVVVVLGCGAVRLSLSRPRRSVKVGLVTSDKRGHVGTAKAGETTERLLKEYAVEVERLAGQGAQVVVLPEKLGTVAAEGSSDGIFQPVADRTGATIVVGVVDVSKTSGPGEYNQARVYAPAQSVQRYDKQHMLPPFESNFVSGTTLTFLEKPHADWAVAICKDLDFTSPARPYGRAGAGLLLVPAWDFNLDRSWHGHIAVMRGVENGFSVARAAKQGYLTVSDDRGRIVAESRSDGAPFVTLLADAPVEHYATVYQRLGDWFGWVVLGILGFTVVRLVLLARAGGRQASDLSVLSASRLNQG